MDTKELWDSKAESLSYEILKELINIEHYNINVHISLKDIFPTETKQPWSDYHIDFLVTDKKGLPVLGIEISGIRHWNNKDLIEHDVAKKRLFSEHAIPLIIIPLGELNNYSKESYAGNYNAELKSMISVHLAHLFYNTSYPAYCWKCNQQYSYRYRLDHTGAFYCCTNKECINCQNHKIFSKYMIPSILSEYMHSYMATKLY